VKQIANWFSIPETPRLDIVPFVSHEDTKRKKERRGWTRRHLIFFA
jgi:hypothetical protein